jgi:hypothetical protein
VLVINEHGVHLRKTKQSHYGATPSPVFQNWKDLVNSVRSWLPPDLQEFAKVVYDPTIIISGTITPDHVDEINWDGPGEVIVNLCLNGDGLLVFSSEANTDADFVGCYMPPNSWIAFTGQLRCAGTHQVLRLEPRPVMLDFSLKKPRPSDRIVLCFRFGEATKGSLTQFNVLFGDRLKLEQEGLAKEAVIVDLTAKVTTLKTKLEQAVKSTPIHWTFKGDQAQIAVNAWTTGSLVLKRTKCPAVKPFHIFRVAHSVSLTDYLVLAVGWILINKRNDKHYIVWTIAKDADDETWGVSVSVELYMRVLTRGCVLYYHARIYLYFCIHVPCVYCMQTQGPNRCNYRTHGG